MKPFVVSIENQDEIRVSLSSGRLTFKGSGCLALIEACKALTAMGLSDANKVPMPKTNSHVDMLLREAILKARKQWNFPYTEEELCHCREVPTKVVDQAILNGIHKVDGIGRYCSAGITCGNCRSDIEAILAYRKTD